MIMSVLISFTVLSVTSNILLAESNLYYPTCLDDDFEESTPSLVVDPYSVVQMDAPW